MSTTSRGLHIGRSALQAGAKSFLQRDMKPSTQFLAALVGLRGAAQKVAQFLSLEDDLAPTFDMVGRSAAVPTMGPAFVMGAVRSEIGRVERHFSSFSPEPFAAASFGQVHAATTHEGQDVVVKVQYLGIAETVRSDMRLLRQAVGLLPQRASYQPLIREVETRLQEECDYVLEAAALRWFGERLQIDGVELTRPVETMSGRCVLTMTRLQGRHLHDWLARNQPGQAERDAAAQRLYDVFVASVHRLGRLHADTNPGNILFQPDGRIGLLDFGCTRWIDSDVRNMIARLWRAAAESDEEAAHDVYLDMGLFAGLSADQAWKVDRESMKPFRDWIARPLRTREFDFGADRHYVSEGRERFVRLLAHHALIGVRPEFILVNRSLYGLYRIFEILGARVDCQAALHVA